MAKKKSSTRKAPENLMARHLFAYLLLLLGIMIFLSAFLHMQGAIFDNLRTFTFGLAGAFGFLLPLFPLWTGLTLLFPGIRFKRTSFLVALLYLLVLACSMLLTYTSYGSIGRVSLMNYFSYHTSSNGGFADMLGQAYAFCASGPTGYAGGLLGTMVAWPLWRFLGSDLAAVILILAIVAVLLSLFHIDLISVVQNIHLNILNAHHERARAHAEKQAVIQKEKLQWKQQEMVREATRRDFQSPPSPHQFSGPVPHVVAGFAQTPEEQPDYRPRVRSRRSAFSRIFGDSQQGPAPAASPAAVMHPSGGNRGTPQEAGPASVAPVPAAHETESFPEEQASPAVQPTPEAAWQANSGASPFAPAETPRKPRRATEPVNPYGHTGRNRPAAAFPDPPETLPEIVPPDDLTVPAQQEEPLQRRPSAWVTQPEQDPVANVTETEEQDMQDPDDVMPTAEELAAPLQQPEPSFRDGKGPVSTRLPVKGDVHLPNFVSTPSTWTPSISIEDPGNVPTYGDAQSGSYDPDEEDTETELPYIFPDPSLLKDPPASSGFSPEEDAERSKRLEDTLSSFKIACQVKHVTHGPAISRFELEIAAGIKVSKITDLGPNIAMNMEVKSVRIEAPIPGKSLVGVEVPNRKVSTVTLKEVLSSDKMMHATDPLVVALGKDIAGTPVICNLARMPHLLIAGATGSGKSVCINTIIGSLLYRTSPDQVRLILVDPKVVELQCYNGIPHLLAPVVSDPHKAAGALQWAVDEMMRRYATFQEYGVRNLDGYNALLEEQEKPMPRIVIIIDELADLMMTCKREVEEYICRIAQLARAAGIHLIVATQRPSVDVITGLIKANIPSRIAFKVSSFIDSRTILDKNGAEQLLGYGDMLYQPMGEFTPTRVQGCFLSDEEVNNIADYIRKTSSARYDESFVQQLAKIENDTGASLPDMTDASSEAGSDTSLLEQCIEIALLDGQVSTSLLQRRLKIGYARAGRLVDEMEKRGIISAKDGAKPRLCLITREEYEQMKQSGLSA